MQSDLDFWDQCALNAISAGVKDPVTLADKVLDARQERYRAAQVAEKLKPDPNELNALERDRIRSGKYIDAIKEYRNRLGCSLVDAKAAIDKVVRGV